MQIFIIPKLVTLRQKYHIDIEHLLATIDQHCIFSVADSQGEIIHANQKFQVLSGYTLPELLGQQHSVVN